MPYRNLNIDAIVKTSVKLQKRINERFPERGLAQVSGEVCHVVEKARQEGEWIRQPLWPIRIAVISLIAGLLLALSRAIFLFNIDHTPVNFVEFVQALEAGINDIIFIGAAIYFLVTIEKRVKRNRILKNLHELRSLAHVIDMHQLTKDPDPARAQAMTASSPPVSMTNFELTRYLDYCSEMLSLIGKVAALYIQDFDDAMVLSAVNEIEALTNSLSGKIWQKIMIIQAFQSYEG
ncbi:MAG: hypothetical protein KJ063_16200 [Anaerolineae bacterium]|nr:hypothetical protein [Anaerolineae bacterium]